MSFISTTEKETIKWAKKYSDNLKGGEVIGLIGNLGAGKTIFTKGLALGLGVDSIVNSPTFVIMKIYSCSHKTIKELIHIDAYRIKSSDIKTIGAYEYFNKPDKVVVIEWADRVRNKLPKNTIYIKINSLNNNSRNLIIQ